MRGESKVTSSAAFLLVILVLGAIIGWLAFGEQGAVTETVQVGGEGIKKAQEIKQLLEQPPQDAF